MKGLQISIVFLCFLLPAKGWTQTSKKIDSLKILIQNSKDDRYKIKAYFAWDELIYLSNKPLDEKINRKIIQLSENNLAKKNGSKNVKKYYVDALMRSLNNVGLNLIEQNKTRDALDYLNRSYELAKKLKNAEMEGFIINNMGMIYRSVHDYEKALFYYQKSFEITKDSTSNPEIFNNIGLCYSDLKDTLHAMQYYRLSLKFSTKDYHQENRGNTLLNMADIYEKAKLFSASLSYHQEAMECNEKIDNKAGITYSYCRMGEINRLQKKLQKAIYYAGKGMEIAIQNDLLFNKRECALILYKSYKDAGNLKLTLYYLEEYDTYNMEFLKRTNQEELIKKQYYYEYKNKEELAKAKHRKEKESLAQKNQLLKQQSNIQDLKIRENRYLIVGLVLLLASIIFIAFLVNRQNKIKSIHLRNEMKQKLLRSQMNPHFIFNAMVGIQNYIYKEEPEVAANYLSSVVHLMRSIIENSKEELVLLEKEISTLEHYLTLQQVRFQGKFDYSIEVAPNIVPENILIPPMMAQPFIENAIEHGILNKQNGRGIITVRFAIRDQKLALDIEDNGVGREKAKENSKSPELHLSIATNITKERLIILNRKAKKVNSLILYDLKDEVGNAIGTKACFLFELKKSSDFSK